MRTPVKDGNFILISLQGITVLFMCKSGQFLKKYNKIG